MQVLTKVDVLRTRLHSWRNPIQAFILVLVLLVLISFTLVLPALDVHLPETVQLLAKWVWGLLILVWLVFSFWGVKPIAALFLYADKLEIHKHGVKERISISDLDKIQLQYRGYQKKKSIFRKLNRIVLRGKNGRHSLVFLLTNHPHKQEFKHAIKVIQKENPKINVEISSLGLDSF